MSYLNPYVIVLHLLSSHSCSFLRLYGLFLCLEQSHMKSGFTLLRHLYTSTIRIRGFCVWIFFFPIKCSSSSYDRLCVSCITLSVLQWVLTIRLSLILPQNIQISGQYLKFDKIYASVNTSACSRFKNFLIRKRALV